jgi:hypothetical protein
MDKIICLADDNLFKGWDDDDKRFSLRFVAK